MKYLWTEDQGAGFHFWQLVNQYLFQGELLVESKESNQGILDAVRALKPAEEDIYYLAFDIVYDNMDIVNKLLELRDLVSKYPRQIQLLDITCFEYIFFSFHKLLEWTQNGRKDVIVMRKYILDAMKDHQIDIDSITDEKTLNYLKGFKHYSTERVIKSMTQMLTDTDAWNVKGELLGSCWHKDCCILESKEKKKCGLDCMTGVEKMQELLSDNEMQKIISSMH